MGHEKSKESILVEIPRTSRTFRQAFEGMEATKNFLPLSVSAGSFIIFHSLNLGTSAKQLIL